jgi:hypothetical protein
LQEIKVAIQQLTLADVNSQSNLVFRETDILIQDLTYYLEAALNFGLKGNFMPQSIDRLPVLTNA